MVRPAAGARLASRRLPRQRRAGIRYLFEQWSRGAFDEFWQQPGIYAKAIMTAMPRCRPCTCQAGTTLCPHRHR